LAEKTVLVQALFKTRITECLLTREKSGLSWFLNRPNL